MNTTFGQNRLPYKDMDWQVLSSEEIDAFYYEGGKNLATYAQKVAMENATKIEEMLSYRLGGKLEIIIFNSIEDLRQSNTGLKEQLFNVGGYTYVVDNKVIAYYNGSHADFERQIKEGIAEIVLSEMIYGSSIQERVQSSSLLFLPSWFFKGLTSYVGNNWDTEIDSKVRDAILSGKFNNFNWLSEEESILAGHSIWNFIALKFGPKNIPEILHLTRASKGFEGAFGFALGITSSQLIDLWLEFYRAKYKESEADRSVPRKLLEIPDNVSRYPHTELKTHPNGKKVAFVMNRNGFWQVKIYDKREKKESTILKGGKHEGYQVINYTYPIIAWEPGGKNLGVIFYEKGKSKLLKLDINGKIMARHTIPNTVDQVLSFDFADENTLLVSAIKNGQTDLYLYHLKEGNLEQLTNDIYDDLWPRFNSDQTQIIFSSNRPYDTLHFEGKYFETLKKGNNLDVFLYDYDKKGNLLKRITNTPYVNEIMPVFYLPGYYSFVSDISGIYNAYACKDTVGFNYSQALITYKNGATDTIISRIKLPDGTPFSVEIEGIEYTVGDTIQNIQTKDVEGPVIRFFPLTNYKRNILGRDMAVTDDAEYNLLMYDDHYQIFETNVSAEVEDDAQYINIVPTEYRLGTGIPFYYGDTIPATAIIPQPKDITVEKGNFTIVPKDSVDIGDTAKPKYNFQTEFPESFILNNPKDKSDELNSNKTSEPKNFFTAMFPDYYVSQLDNSILNTYYHINTGGNGPSVFARMNLMIQVKTTITDLLGNHRVVAGLRYPFSLNGSDYFIEYYNRRHRVNWDVGFFRQSRRADGAIINRQLINQFTGGIKLPVNETVSVRFQGFGRQDRSVILGTDSATLGTPDKTYTWAGTKAELVFDNTKNIDINLPYGTRFKAFAEFYQNTEQGNRRLLNLGIDYRKYVKLHHKIIWATRVTANSSVGPAKVQYFIGGVENWIGSSYNNAISRGEGTQYIFQAQANSLRGFKQNIRNGTNYLLLSTEVRFPLAAYVTQKPVRADYLRNFMLVPFADLGTAWYGTSPFTEQPYNTNVVYGPGYTVTVTTADNPIVGSVGLGLRTRLFGYYLRTDFAWGIVNGHSNGMMTQFALGYDF